MLRRPPTIITVGEEDIQHVMDSMFLTSFSKDFDKLKLEEQRQGNNGSSAFDHSPMNSGASSSGPGEDGNVNPNRGQARGPFCTGNQFTAPDNGLVMGPTNPMAHSPSFTAQSAHSVDTDNTDNVPATTLLGSSTPFPQPTHPRPGRQAGTWFTLPLDSDVETGSSSSQKQENNCRTNPFQDAWAASKDAEHSRLPTLQESHESVDNMPETTSTSFHPGT